MPNHTPPKASKITAYSFTFIQIQTSFYKGSISTQSSGPRCTKPKKIINNGATMHLHALPRTCDDQWLSPSKLCKSVHNFTKLTLQRSFTTLELQNLKIASLKTEAHITICRQNIWRWKPSATRATPSAYALICVGASLMLVHAPSSAMMSLMMSSSTNRFDPN